ncbi:hypothetical protein PXJ25_27760, partial [Klebsiella pneumoniae]
LSPWDHGPTCVIGQVICWDHGPTCVVGQLICWDHGPTCVICQLICLGPRSHLHRRHIIS